MIGIDKLLQFESGEKQLIRRMKPGLEKTVDFHPAFGRAKVAQTTSPSTKTTAPG
jgi:hypothetical protein